MPARRGRQRQALPSQRNRTRSDLCQLLSYSFAADLPRGLLIYAAVAARARLARDRSMSGKTSRSLRSISRGRSDDILGQVGQLTERISGMQSEPQDSSGLISVPAVE